MAIVKLAPEYTSDDLASDLQHLFDLVDTVVDSLVENRSRESGLR
jgi:hypothetical protein